MRDSSGKIIANGDLIQEVRGAQVILHVTFSFRDGSLDDETTIYTQQGTFRLLGDHHIQKGPSYPHPLDMTVKATTGLVTVRSIDKDGHPKVTTDHLDLPPDIANGLDFVVVKDLPPGESQVKLPVVVATPKPRLIKLAIGPVGDDWCLIGGVRRKVAHLVARIELGGVTGVVAPMIGKQPDDINLWMMGGEVPAVLKLEGQFYPGGPVWTIEPAAPSWPAAPAASKNARK